MSDIEKPQPEAEGSGASSTDYEAMLAAAKAETTARNRLLESDEVQGIANAEERLRGNADGFYKQAAQLEAQGRPEAAEYRQRGNDVIKDADRVSSDLMRDRYREMPQEEMQRREHEKLYEDGLAKINAIMDENKGDQVVLEALDRGRKHMEEQMRKEAA